MKKSKLNPRRHHWGTQTLKLNNETDDMLMTFMKSDRKPAQIRSSFPIAAQSIEKFMFFSSFSPFGPNDWKFSRHWRMTGKFPVIGQRLEIFPSSAQRLEILHSFERLEIFHTLVLFPVIGLSQ